MLRESTIINFDDALQFLWETCVANTVNIIFKAATSPPETRQSRNKMLNWRKWDDCSPRHTRRRRLATSIRQMERWDPLHDRRLSASLEGRSHYDPSVQVKREKEISAAAVKWATQMDADGQLDSIDQITVASRRPSGPSTPFKASPAQGGQFIIWRLKHNLVSTDLEPVLFVNKY